MVAPLIGLAGPLISGVAGFFTKKQERKKAAESAAAKLRLRKEDGQQIINLTDAEWESIATESQSGTWKDEYVTLIITAPIVMVLVGAVWHAFDPENDRLLRGTLMGIDALNGLGLEYGYISTAVVLAAIGLKMWRAK